MRHTNLSNVERNELATVVLDAVGNLLDNPELLPEGLDRDEVHAQLRIWTSYIPAPVRNLSIEPEYAEQQAVALVERETTRVQYAASKAEQAAKAEAKVEREVTRRTKAEAKAAADAKRLEEMQARVDARRAALEAAAVKAAERLATAQARVAAAQAAVDATQGKVEEDSTTEPVDEPVNA